MLLSQLLYNLLIRRARRQRRKILQNSVEASRRHDVDDAHWFFPHVCKRMWHSLWSAEKVARVQLKQFIANLDRKSAFNDEEGIVLLIMKVQGGPLQVTAGCLYEVKAAIDICACNPKQPWLGCNHDGLLSLSLSDDQR